MDFLDLCKFKTRFICFIRCADVLRGGHSYSKFKTIGYKFAELVENCLMGLAEETKAMISWPTWEETGIFKER